ncbi:deoxyribodipyrimidine photo-lyase [Arenicella chitinivorans]|uniref:Deoxyribodipyrimidine photo-lyase n=1 Tax=Arenicella chitinivorans TaxID=1329800 RepID=A0A918VJ94_9GAMM|nr:deoxyribodipyrimidine photo-lyase [Arenicella chitinivorans]GHA01811.1 deoxyribodipyrimidine photo-lyase [Arenicella chitinivorans]
MNTTQKLTLVWLREDLRLDDNPALSHAAARGAVLPIYFFPDEMGAASRWWLHHSLKTLQQQCADAGAPLLLLDGDPISTIPQIAKQTGATQVVWNRVYSPAGIELGKTLKQSLAVGQVDTQSFNANLLIEPSKILTKQGTPFKVFTPFWRHSQQQISPQEPLSAPARLTSIAHELTSRTLDDWALLPSRPNWARGFGTVWEPGEFGAESRWTRFLEETISKYKDGRDLPAKQLTSMLSPHLAFGEISVRRLWLDVQEAMATGEVSVENGSKFLAEIGWREFSRYLLCHFPRIEHAPFNPKFEDFPWQTSALHLAAWQQGRTGYPIVDAGMRELWQTGYMHNRVRMICASFLTKHLLIHWQSGADWFWDTLVDADLANNTASWQWVAGCGADAAPYFRIFNPVLQGQKFDKHGDYVRRWVPELANLPDKYVHQPWAAAQTTLLDAGLVLGKDYPKPVVDHSAARQAALDAYAQIKSN